MLDTVFMQVIDMSKMASIAIVIVIIARLALKRFPKFISYALWFVVLFRLLCPISFESVISMMPEMTSTSYHYSLADEKISILGAGEAAYQAVGDALNGGLGVQHIKTMEIDENGNVKYVTSNWFEVGILCGQYVWLLGIGVLLIYSFISYKKVKQKISTAIPLKENVYIVDEEISPFVMGIIQPKIYLPRGLGEKEQTYIILHEQFHIKRFDYIVKVLAFAALCIHWFNPMVWLAFFLFSQDMEMSCDEAVIRKLGEETKAEYSETLLALATGHRMIRGVPLAFGEGNTKGRIKNMALFKNTHYKIVVPVFAVIVILIICMAVNPKTQASNVNDFDEIQMLSVSLDITEHYITNIGDPANLYYIDKNNVLWGGGRNNCGQLGQGTQDYEFHDALVKIAENVVHVDYSQKEFVIYLTADHKLYGFGNAGSGALQQYDDFDWTRYSNPESYYISEPCLLMENVIYARCGQSDIACLTEDGSVWTWGTVCMGGGYASEDVYFEAKPVKVLENAILVTGGWYNHAALLRDGTVWTWGYNFTGNCGVKDEPIVTEPTKVADGVVMVWTGTTEYNSDMKNMAEFEGEYPRQLENTIIKKADGSYWICGADVGDVEREIPYYNEVLDYRRICTHVFHPIEETGFELKFSE